MAAAGRLRRRARLSRSQNVFGKGLLALLSRNKLDDDTWDEIEETLVGVSGSGKTTTSGKIARLLVADGHTVVLGTADTFRGVAAGRGVDTVVIDTAGRPLDKAGLTNELGKVRRVVERHGSVSETLLVVDAPPVSAGWSRPGSSPKRRTSPGSY